MSKLSISVIIPNYNGAHLLERNLPTVLAAAAAYDHGTEVIVVDDGSSDSSVDLLKNRFPEIRCVVHEKNRGFAEAVHSGVREASGELCFLLNSDVQPDINCLAPLADYFPDEHVFAVSPTIYNESGTVENHSWYAAEFRHGSLKRLPWNLTDALVARKNGHLPQLYTSGGSMLVPKTNFELMGGFHPLYKPFYSEDVDLGIRAWRRGLASYFEPNSKVIHQSQGSIKDAFKRGLVKRMRKRNKYLLEWVHIPLWRLLAQSLPFTLMQLLGELILLDRVNLGGFADALRRINEVRAVRAELKIDECLSMEQVIEKITAGVRN